ncbi:MAG: hypothetical protein IK132_01970, partial [Clostridia bacterium]|nr:hypothetical protein [Clostridia bacterium]
PREPLLQVKPVVRQKSTGQKIPSGRCGSIHGGSLFLFSFGLKAARLSFKLYYTRKDCRAQWNVF